MSFISKGLGEASEARSQNGLRHHGLRDWARAPSTALLRRSNRQGLAAVVVDPCDAAAVEDLGPGGGPGQTALGSCPAFRRPSST